MLIVSTNRNPPQQFPLVINKIDNNHYYHHHLSSSHSPIELYRFRKNGADSDRFFGTIFYFYWSDSDVYRFSIWLLWPYLLVRLWYAEDYALYFICIHCYLLSGVYDKIQMYAERRVCYIKVWAHKKRQQNLCTDFF